MLSLFCYSLLCVHSSFAIILKRKRNLVALLLLSYRCLVTVNVLWLFLTVPLVGLQFFFFCFFFKSPHNMMCRGSGRAIPLFTSYNNFIQLYVTRSHAFHSSVHVHICILIRYE